MRATPTTAPPERATPRPASQTTAQLRILCVVPFLNEQRYLPRFLESINRQERFPDLLVLVDDGSSDSSAAIASQFAAAHGNVRLLRRASRAPERDRLAGAAELRAFQWAVEQVHDDWDLVVKMDGDLDLGADLFSTLERAFLTTPELGIAGAFLNVVDRRSGALVREPCPPHHVRGATKFYRRECLRQISPVPAILGWDTIDEIAARRRGWRTCTLACEGGGAIHLRPVGQSDGRLRAQYRWGVCAYAIGQHPLWVMLSAARRALERPPIAGSLAFLAGWTGAAVRRRPRAPSEVRAFGRREQLSVLRARARLELPA